MTNCDASNLSNLNSNGLLYQNPSTWPYQTGTQPMYQYYPSLPTNVPVPDVCTCQRCPHCGGRVPESLSPLSTPFI